MDLIKSLATHQVSRFLVVGSCGVGINLACTWFFTTFVFGLEGYFSAYLIGIAANLAFNFTLYTIAVFGTKTKHARRLFFYVAYSLLMTALQASVVKTVTARVGLEWYLVVIATTIAVFAGINFLVLKLSIFREVLAPDEES